MRAGRLPETDVCRECRYAGARLPPGVSRAWQTAAARPQSPTVTGSRRRCPSSTERDNARAAVTGTERDHRPY